MPLYSLRAALTVAGLLAFVIGLPRGLYLLLTRSQRRRTRDIRAGARERGWRYRIRHWQGNPTAFRIDGQTPSGVAWILTSTDSRGYERGWSVRLSLRFPALGGETDIAVVSRTGDSRFHEILGPGMPANAAARLAGFSGVLASAVEFLRRAHELPSGHAAFDAAYQVLALTQRTNQPLVDTTMARRFLEWPAAAVTPHSFLAWRDAFAFHLQAMLPEQANWPAVAYFVSIAEDWVARIPPPSVPAARRTFVDRLAARFFADR